MEMQPAAISDKPEIIIRCVVFSTPLKPAVRANGTVSPSDIPIIMSFTKLEFERCVSFFNAVDFPISNFLSPAYPFRLRGYNFCVRSVYPAFPVLDKQQCPRAVVFGQLHPSPNESGPSHSTPSYQMPW